MIISLKLFNANFLFCQTDSSLLIPTIQIDTVTIVEFKDSITINDFIQYVENDTSFYEAFRNLRRINYTSACNVRMFNKDYLTKATYSNRSIQTVFNNCRSMHFLYENSTGDFFDDDNNMYYYTAKMFSYIFLYRDTICDAVAKTENNSGESALDKHKDQLKTLIFNPGKPVDGIPLLKNKTAIFSPAMMSYYNYSITSQTYKTGVECYVFSVVKKPEVKDNDVVIHELTTWFDKKDLSIVSRNYQLSYKAPIFSFNVAMDVRISIKEGLPVPTYIYYNGFWDIPARKPEIGSVEITLH